LRSPIARGIFQRWNWLIPRRFDELSASSEFPEPGSPKKFPAVQARGNLIRARKIVSFLQSLQARGNAHQLRRARFCSPLNHSRIKTPANNNCNPCMPSARLSISR
jgi:hypothetical protein